MAATFGPGLWVGLVLVAMPVAVRAVELLIRLRHRERLEAARQATALNLALLVQPGTVVLVQQPDRTVCVLVRTRTAGSSREATIS